jgi:eukaryotic-like serine/threonine-protein kinase
MDPVDRGNGDVLRPGTMLGRYEIKRLLGQGGMGRVYEAEHRELKKRVAIKALLPALAASEDARQRFLREGEAASRIRHPHVVDVTDVGSEGSVIFLVMEYLEGEDLSHLIERQGFLPPVQSVEILLPVAAAIATAHDQGVIHRDLKPENIFLARTAVGGIQPKVLDFGISKVLGGSRTQALTGTAATMGTLNYLPPESLNAARDADARSDQYGLGVILYECVTGQRAFDEPTFYQVLKKIAEGQFAPPCAVRPELPRRLESVILRAMSLEPAQRFESVRHFGAALLEFASDAARAFWASSFAAAAAPFPASSAAATQVDVGDGIPRRDEHDRPSGGLRVRTLPSSPSGAGGTLELPSDLAPPRPPSTTMRGATGERWSHGSISPPRRSRMPLVLGGIGLVGGIAVIAAIAIPRALDPSGQRTEPPALSSTAAAADPGLPVVSPPVPVRAVPVAPTPTSAIEIPAPVEPPVPSENDATAAAGKRRGGANALRKNARAGALRSGAGKRSRSAPEGPDSPPAPAPAKSSNDVVIID